jgi:aspartate kinase
MIVMKFGGTSIADAASIERVASIVHRSLDQGPVIVNSAMEKTTRKLLDAAQYSAAGAVRDAMITLSNIYEYHTSLAEQLLAPVTAGDTNTMLAHYYDELVELLDGLSILRELPPRSQDRILSYGELMATAITSQVFRERHIQTVLCDARNFIITDDRFTGARPFEHITYDRVREYLQPVVDSGRVPVVQGFIGSTRNGDTTTLGFEGSDFTAALIGAALGVSHIQIWKDVNGIMTADPAVCPGVHTIKTISFAEAAKLTFFGAKVLHPSSIQPARSKNIPVHIYNSKAPDAVGTMITAHSKPGEHVIKSIAYKTPVTVMQLRGEDSVSPHHLLRSTCDMLDCGDIVPYVMTSEGSNITMVLNEKEDIDHLAEELSPYGAITIGRDKAAVTLVGENLSTHRILTGLACQSLTGTNIEMIAQGSSPIAFTVIVDGKDMTSVIASLHETFFSDPDPELFE